MQVNSSVLPRVDSKICLLDAGLSMLKALDRLLASAGLQTQLFSEPLGFLSYVIRNSVPVAVIYIWLATGISGLDVQTKLHGLSPQTRVIISTADNHAPVRDAPIKAGAIGYFGKPFDENSFHAARHP